MTQPNGNASHHSAPNANGVVRPWAADFNPGSKTFTTLDGKPVDWNGGWAGIGGETAGPQSAPAPLTSKSGPNNQEITYLPYPELTCLHCLGSNPPGKLGYVVSYLPVIPAGTNGSQQSLGKGLPQQSADSGESYQEDRLGELPVRPPAPSLGSFRTGRSALKSNEKGPRSRSRAEERVDDFERGRQIEREAQEERARSSSVSWELAGVGKQYIPDGEDEDNVIE
ncbi:hypothetical protein I302_100991 [Kwoniella bestiolae CBS 10118]|uniref:Uncharacterized protein n=1 Tax=Kwoniella bestiolae CBS 10118 TaxID=1296100 RepID=A0A1B9G6R5_9TREE|nr:hypothetical protein I302_04368 [Kwoniella bestiolae CBS 10118]OCF26681.1 hypothetical protein I302_04368 [Kwoniella bestiolae CBS 10118]